MLTRSLTLLSVIFQTALLANSASIKEIDQHAINAGSDKSSLYHNYTKVYGNYFADLKHQPIVFLEIGIDQGASVKIWESFFKNAEFHFIDNNQAAIQYHSTYSHYHILDQANVEALTNFANGIGKTFDVIIDDGSHMVNHQLISFDTLFPYLSPGGIYIIEDLNTSYWKPYGGDGTLKEPKAGPQTTIGFLKGLVDDVNRSGAMTGCADIRKTPKSIHEKLSCYQKEIEFIHFYNSICVIKKRK